MEKYLYASALLQIKLWTLHNKRRAENCPPEI
jgi:hypothetical protein